MTKFVGNITKSKASNINRNIVYLAKYCLFSIPNFKINKVSVYINSFGIDIFLWYKKK